MARTPATRLTFDTLVYGLGSSAGRVASIVFVPIFARIFAREDYGALELLTTISSLLLGLALAGMNSAVFYFYRRVEDPVQRRRLVGTALVAAATAGVVFGAIGLAVAEPVADRLLNDRRYTLAVALTFIGLPIGVLSALSSDLLRLEFRAVAFSILGIGKVVLASLVGVVLAVSGMGVAGLLAAYAGIGVLGAVAALWITRQAWTPALDLGRARALLRYGLPLVPTGLAYWVMAYSDRYFVLEFNSLADVGLYAMANRVATILHLAIAAFTAAWWPFAFSQAADPNHRNVFARVFRAFGVGIVILALGLGLFAREILIVVTTPTFVPAYPYAGLLAFALAVNGIYGIVSVGIALTGRTWHMAWTSATAAGTNLVLNLLLIPTLGILGAAVSTLAAYAVSASLLYVVAQRSYPIPYPLPPVAFVAALSGAVLAGGLAVDATLAAAAWSPAVTAVKLLGFWIVALVGLRLSHVSARALLGRLATLRGGESGA